MLLRLDYLVLYCVVFFTHVQKKIFFHEVCCHKYDIYEKSHFVLLPMKITSSQLAAIAFRFFDVIVSFLITALLIIITLLRFELAFFGGIKIPPKNSYSNQATQKNTCQIFVPKKIPESKISNPKKSFDHPRHLKSRVSPLGTYINLTRL